MGAAVGLRRFTRTEMFVGLVVTALAVGGVFKAQAMVADAKVNRIENDYRDLSAAILSYKDRYQVLPTRPTTLTASRARSKPSSACSPATPTRSRASSSGRSCRSRRGCARVARYPIRQVRQNPPN